MELHEIIKTMAKEADENWGKLYYHVLAGIINKEGFTKGAEIGVAFGGHADYMLNNCPGLKKLYCVDPYTPDYNSTDGYALVQGEPFGPTEYEELYLHALHRLRRHKDRQELIRQSSHEGWATVLFDRLPAGEKLDFVFIDGRHTFGDVMADIELWRQIVRPGGIISGHDYMHESYPGVTRAIAASFQFINAEDGFVWWSRK